MSVRLLAARWDSAAMKTSTDGMVETLLRHRFAEAVHRTLVELGEVTP